MDLVAVKDFDLFPHNVEDYGEPMPGSSTSERLSRAAYSLHTVVLPLPLHPRDGQRSRKLRISPSAIRHARGSETVDAA